MGAGILFQSIQNFMFKVPVSDLGKRDIARRLRALAPGNCPVLCPTFLLSGSLIMFQPIDLSMDCLVPWFHCMTIYKLDGVAPLMTDPPPISSTTL